MVKSYLYVINMQATKIAVCFLFLLVITGCQTGSKSTNLPVKINKNKFEFKLYRVIKGDTFYSLSKRFHTSIHVILLDNNLRTSKPLEIGQKLFIRSKISVNSQVKRKSFYTFKRSQKVIHKPQPKTYKAKSRIKNSTVIVKGNPPYMLIPRGTGYTKPMSGKIIKRYSNYDGGRPLFGVNIRSYKSQSVKSIHNGVVVFKAENFANFGRCILVAHSKKENCFYYGLNKVSLNVGDVINKGYSLGKIRKNDILGLKILRNDYFVNPQKVIPRL
ncbi:MAG: hypothetical protein COA79_06165 [Planctomycetota bacterium]|nr:MAG: hypothetical protein COA79_06165 [Planctomycetota bacterium]